MRNAFINISVYSAILLVCSMFGCNSGKLYVDVPNVQCAGIACGARCSQASDCPAGYSCVNNVCYQAPDKPPTPPPCVTTNICGTCLPAPFCTNEQFGGSTGDEAFPEATINGIIAAPNGGITLPSAGSIIHYNYAWPANSGEGTVSLVDTITYQEKGRYASVNNNQVVPDWTSGCNYPSRTAIDISGNAFVANRNYAEYVNNSGCIRNVKNWSVGSVTKIGFYNPVYCVASNNPSHNLSGCACVDKNGDGVITTSQDFDGNGEISLYTTCQGPCSVKCKTNADCSTTGIYKYCLQNHCSQYPQEFFGYQDECLLYTQPLPVSASDQNGAVVRALALDLNGDVWAGDYRHAQIFKLRNNDGIFLNPNGTGLSPTKAALALGVRPYGAVVDHNGIISTVEQDNGYFQRFNTSNGNVLLNPASAATPGQELYGAYGITVDEQGFVWTTAHDTNIPVLYAYNPGAATWATYEDTEYDYLKYDYSTAYNANTFYGRGLVAQQGNNYIWAVFNTGGYNVSPNATSWLVGFNGNTGTFDFHVNVNAASNGQCLGPIGVDVGGDGETLWLVNQFSNTLCGYNPGNGVITAAVAIGELPYTYSDFTGSVYRNFTLNEAAYPMLFNGCNDPNYRVNYWVALNWEALTPGNSSIIVEIKAADSVADLANEPYSIKTTIDAASGSSGSIKLPFVNLEALGVLFTLLPGSQGEVPTLTSVSVARNCLFVGGS